MSSDPGCYMKKGGLYRFCLGGCWFVTHLRFEVCGSVGIEGERDRCALVKTTGEGGLGGCKDHGKKEGVELRRREEGVKESGVGVGC